MKMFSALMIAGLITICVYGLLREIMKLDNDHGMKFSPRVWCMLILESITGAVLWQLTTAEETVAGRYIWLLIHIYFIVCSLTDKMTCQVYDLFQYLGIAAGICLLWREEASSMAGISILLFALLQYLVFNRFYGEADTMAFLVAALVECALGYGLQMYLLHMILSYLLLSLIQIFVGNIGRGGKLKKPVPFLPYITAGFWTILIWGDRIQYYIR